MSIITQWAEKKIQEAIRKGDLDNLAGSGKPINLDDDYSRVPAHLRMGYKILKNSGFVPPELEERKTAMKLKDLIDQLDPKSDEYIQSSKKLEHLRIKLEIAGINTDFLQSHYFKGAKKVD